MAGRNTWALVLQLARFLTRKLGRVTQAIGHGFQQETLAGFHGAHFFKCLHGK